MKYKHSQLYIGKKIELEHKRTYDWFIERMERNSPPTLQQFAESIAIDHLNEFPKYYTYLEVMEDLIEEIS